MILKTNVKLNFGLFVLRRRPDGFHDLETLFVPWHGYGDTLEIIAGDDYNRTFASLAARYGADGSDGPGAPLRQAVSEDGRLMITVARREGVDWDPLSDLSARACRLLQQDFDLPPVKLFLEKTAPVGAGLGGGSADAAFTLKGLNECFGLGLDDAALVSYAARLGSDCALFIHNRPMIGTGRGEVLEPYDLSLEGYDLQVIVPEGVGVSTAEAYRGITPREAAGQTAGEPDGTAIRRILARPVEEWKGLLVNDFEATVFPLHHELEAIRDSLYASGAVYASMSGSGSALFALYRKEGGAS